MPDAPPERPPASPAARPPLTDAAARRFAAYAVLDRVIAGPERFHAALLEGDDAFLEPAFDDLLAANWVAIADDDRYRATPAGRGAYQRLLHLQQSYLAHFDIFAAVDLLEGRFADPRTDYLDDPRWADLRVAVAEYKGIDPYRLVFLSMLAGGAFFENPGWKFDVALGSAFFRELTDVVGGQIAIDELGYRDEDGTELSGEAVLQDVMLQGAAINLRALGEQTREDPAEEAEEAEADWSDGAYDPEQDGAREETSAGAVRVLVPYDPLGPAAAYASSATFVEPIWLDAGF